MSYTGAPPPLTPPMAKPPTSNSEAYFFEKPGSKAEVQHRPVIWVPHEWRGHAMHFDSWRDEFMDLHPKPAGWKKYSWRGATPMHLHDHPTTRQHCRAGKCRCKVGKADASNRVRGRQFLMAAQQSIAKKDPTHPLADPKKAPAFTAGVKRAAVDSL